VVFVCFLFLQVGVFRVLAIYLLNLGSSFGGFFGSVGTCVVGGRQARWVEEQDNCELFCGWCGMKWGGRGIVYVSKRENTPREKTQVV
jgi:hypothetical protein